MQLSPRPGAPPRGEIVVHRRAWRQVSRQRPPLAPRLENVEDRVQHLAKIDLASPALTAPRYIHQRLHQRPLRIRHVARIAKTLPFVAPAVRRRPHRRLPQFGVENRITNGSSDSSLFRTGSYRDWITPIRTGSSR